MGVLDHIAEVGTSAVSHHIKFTQFPNKKRPDSVIAIVHDDDLQLVKEVIRRVQITILYHTSKTPTDAHTQDILTADVVKDFLHRYEIGVLVENGGTCTASLQGVQALNTSFDSCIPTKAQGAWGA